MSRNQLNRALLPSWLLENNKDLKVLNLRNIPLLGNLILFHNILLVWLLWMRAPTLNWCHEEVVVDLSLDLSFNNLSGEFPKELVKKLHCFVFFDVNQ
ncbi:putative LRR receptor-like serine/threonine-protein kinase [Gossypium australe]|uniref:Putative LRR receptor-like serine/threonine-protein kinase n=1 Tax=Gossypium australe TaxID=47621 RepID=A0A5B6VF17_9ROSI|nr:putative LRR receptor-like serine/threonine-protein kinase [Gossypium australe]